jgi:hypothetical protein
MQPLFTRLDAVNTASEAELALESTFLTLQPPVTNELTSGGKPETGRLSTWTTVSIFVKIKASTEIQTFTSGAGFDLMVSLKPQMPRSFIC